VRLKKVLIANRGEIALRIIATARRLGLKTVAVASEPDLALPFARAADEVVPIGPGPAAESYLAVDRIIAAARATGADCIHPGYGFLAENPEFAEAVAGAGLTFVGPPAEAMRKLGGKSAAKDIAVASGVPVVPGYHGTAQDAATLKQAAREIGYPVLIKAVAGGGGRGMRLLASEENFEAALESAQREAEAAFGDPRVLLEKLVLAPRHIEVQVFGDRHGNVVHLFERDCTLQRRNQKVIEEAPAPGMSRELRAKMTAAAVKLAKAAGYEGAGTVEFLVEGGRLGRDARWYFIEMNTRLQVEHPVTEAVTGTDLVEWQLRVAAGEPLPLEQAAIRLSGHAVEARLCAEDPASGFLPAVGPVVAFDVPEMPGLRVDRGVEAGSIISPYYDSLIAKLIASAPSREAAIARLAEALEQTVVAGPRTNASFLHALLSHPAFAAGTMDTGLIGRELAALAPAGFDARAAEAGIECLLEQRRKRLEGQRRGISNECRSPWDAGDAFQLGAPRCQVLRVVAGGREIDALVHWDGGRPAVTVANPTPEPSWPRRSLKVVAGEDRVYVLHDMRQMEVGWPQYEIDGAAGDDHGDGIRAPINGRLAQIFVAEGDAVVRGQRIAVVEAMKMEHLVTAPREGRIARIAGAAGQQVKQGALIAELARDQGTPAGAAQKAGTETR
jgi:3-methylcrotonyl-CoA carboxylase alpha subunit